MKGLIIAIALLNFHFISNAQEDEDVKAFISRVGWQQGDTNFWEKISINVVLQLPSVYKVISRELAYASKGEIYKRSYEPALDSIKRGHPTEKLPVMSLSWLLNAITSKDAKKGDEFMVDNIWVRKDDKTFKLKSKAIIVK